MKKRMFITTIVMMLVLAIALTTSSLAWFSSAQGSVTANAAEFTAGTASGAAVNLKIKSNWSDAWGNDINLNNTGVSLTPVVPTDGLYATAGTAFRADGEEINNVQYKPSYGAYAWPNGITFTTAKIGSEGRFIITPGENAASTIQKTDTGIYYKEFYIHNAGAQNALDSLTFRVNADMTVSDDDDHTAVGFAAFILFDRVTYTSPAEGAKAVIPANAYGYTEATEVANGSSVTVWVPFAAFTFVTGNTTTAGYRENWQFGNLDAKTLGVAATKVYKIGETYYNPATSANVEITSENYDTLSGLQVSDSNDTAAPMYYKDGTYVDANFASVTISGTDDEDQTKTLYVGYTYSMNNALVNSLKVQGKDATTADLDTADSGFTLNYTSLRALNGKGKSDGNVVAGVNTDNASKFYMIPGEIYKVDFYYWLDGELLDEYSDATLSNVSIKILAGAATTGYKTDAAYTVS